MPSLIHRTPADRPVLDVAGLNEITVLVDRSETELTEVAINSWTPGLDGPPHAHEHKEQVFFVTKGRGRIQIGDAKFPATPGDLFYVPLATIHQTINETQDRLEYFLYNGFLDSEKEGHASFADHIQKVKDTRRQQAESGSANAGGAAVKPSGRNGLCARLDPDVTFQTLLPREATRRAEVEARVLAAGEVSSFEAADKEQTVFALRGSGHARGNGEVVELNARDVLFVRRGEKVSLTAASSGLCILVFGTVVTR